MFYFFQPIIALPVTQLPSKGIKDVCVQDFCKEKKPFVKRKEDLSYPVRSFEFASLRTELITTLGRGTKLRHSSTPTKACVFKESFRILHPIIVSLLTMIP